MSIPMHPLSSYALPPVRGSIAYTVEATGEAFASRVDAETAARAAGGSPIVKRDGSRFLARLEA